MKISRKSLGDEVYTRLLESIMSGEFPAGAALREEKVCEQLGVSRTPLREAMIRLTREGLLEKKPNCGCVVRKPPPEELAELMEGRALLEGLVVRKWFHRLDQEAFKALDRRLREADSGDPRSRRRKILGADEDMHELILSACPNRFVAEQIRHLRTLCGPYRAHRCAVGEDIGEMREERRRITRAVIAGDPAKAEAALAEHFERSLSHYARGEE